MDGIVHLFSHDDHVVASANIITLVMFIAVIWRPIRNTYRYIATAIRTTAKEANRRGRLRRTFLAERCARHASLYVAVIVQRIITTALLLLLVGTQIFENFLDSGMAGKNILDPAHYPFWSTIGLSLMLVVTAFRAVDHVLRLSVSVIGITTLRDRRRRLGRHAARRSPVMLDGRRL